MGIPLRTIAGLLLGIGPIVGTVEIALPKETFGNEDPYGQAGISEIDPGKLNSEAELDRAIGQINEALRKNERVRIERVRRQNLLRSWLDILFLQTAATNAKEVSFTNLNQYLVARRKANTLASKLPELEKLWKAYIAYCNALKKYGTAEYWRLLNGTDAYSHTQKDLSNLNTAIPGLVKKAEDSRDSADRALLTAARAIEAFQTTSEQEH
jgi:hypothetical protein